MFNGSKSNDSSSIRTNVFRQLLQIRSENSAIKWLDLNIRKLSSSDDFSRVFATTFSLIPRFFPRKRIQLDHNDRQDITALQHGRFLEGWPLDQLARAFFLSTGFDRKKNFTTDYHQLFEMADTMELIALYRSLPFMPDPEKHLLRAEEGTRSNAPEVFNAIFLRNPYPAEYFSDIQWNNGVLKAAFIGSPFSNIHGLERRRNSALEASLSNYLKERKAANRAVPKDLIRFLHSASSKQAARERIPT